jgi:hypothetical protein
MTNTKIILQSLEILFIIKEVQNTKLVSIEVTEMKPQGINRIFTKYITIIDLQAK